MPTAREVAMAFERIAPLESGVPGDELGFIFGNPDRIVRGVGCSRRGASHGVRPETST
jgi:hypothetical protein